MINEKSMLAKLQGILKEYWGYDSFRPFQKDAMLSALSERDSVVVLPTGGGKSLCFQAPALAMDGMAVVVSPLISLMKDQVDALCGCGVGAVRIDSSQSEAERGQVRSDIASGKVKLLYVSPERLMQANFVNYLKQLDLSMIAIDEAHCISMWGHDFRKEYRQLGELKKILPGVAIHSYTATATGQVQEDIVSQLGLENPSVLIGSFDRANLVYRVEPVKNEIDQVCEVIDRNKGESGIIYCIRRKDVDSMCATLGVRGYKALPYHAGMNDEARKMNQDAFIHDKVDIIVATIAFGMGIDKSNVRFVIHAGMPKSVENYQQESGRAGRDGLEAECCLFYSGNDYRIWKFFADQAEGTGRAIALKKLSGIYGFCTSGCCRHRVLVEYFGQSLDKTNCAGCDVCLGDHEYMEDSLVIGQKVLSGVVRLEERFGADYNSLVLIGSKDKGILENGHEGLSTYGLLSDYSRGNVRDWVEQLVGQGFLAKTGDYNVLSVTDAGRELLKGEAEPKLMKPLKKDKKKKKRKSKIADQSWEGVDEGLFEDLRALRKELADEKGVPAFVVFGDAALRDMARKRPSSGRRFMEINGVGHKKRKDYGEMFVETISRYCADNELEMDLF